MRGGYTRPKTMSRRVLQLVMMGDQRNPTARDYVRAARAAHALGRFDDANAFFRDADGLARRLHVNVNRIVIRNRIRYTEFGGDQGISAQGLGTVFRRRH